KRDPRSSWGWIAVIMLSPFLGPLIYFFFGINRVKSRGQKLLEKMPFSLSEGCSLRDEHSCDMERAQIPMDMPEALVPKAWLDDAIYGRPRYKGHRITPRHTGDQAYPAMLEAIYNSHQNVHLGFYIFEPADGAMRFIDDLTRAHERGCDVRVVIDGVCGFKPFGKSAYSLLNERGVNCRRFLRPSLIPPSMNINLLCHHKNLIVDKKFGFTCGINISAMPLYESYHPDL
ncbi:phospholipase D-like domain-containing protein, partial [Oceanidesulfovibrio marinus]